MANRTKLTLLREQEPFVPETPFLFILTRTVTPRYLPPSITDSVTSQLLLGAAGVEFAFWGGTFFPLYPCVRYFVCGTEGGVSLFLFMWNLQFKSDKGDLVDLSFKGSRSGLALLASVSFTCSSAEVYRAWKNGI